MSAVPAGSDRDVLVTPYGYEQLVGELRALRTVRRPELAEQFRQARTDADADNPVIYDLLEERAQLESRISVLEEQVAAARIAPPSDDGSVGIGSLVRVRHLDSGEVVEYELVGSIEADVGSGRVSVDAPVGHALVGGLPGEKVVVETPRGKRQLEILSVRSGGGRRSRRTV